MSDIINRDGLDEGNADESSPILQPSSEINAGVIHEEPDHMLIDVVEVEDDADASRRSDDGQLAAEESNVEPESSGVYRWFENSLRRIGLCTCVVQECMGNQRTCRICEPKKLERYKKLEEDYYKLEFGEDVERRYRDSTVIKFHLGSPEVRDFYPLLVTNTMTALNVIRGISVNIGTLDAYRYSIIECWREFEAERTVDDHELILDMKRRHMQTNHHFLFVYQRDLDKYEYIRRKEIFFVHPDLARRIYKKKPDTEDPSFIQVMDPFYSRSYKPTLCIFPDPLSEKPSSKPLFMPKVETHSVPSTFGTQPKTPTDPIPSTSTETSPDYQNVSYLEEMPIIDSFEDDDEQYLANPIFCGTVYVKQSDKDLTVEEVKKLPNQKEKAKWAKKYLLLRDRVLYFVDDHENMLKLHYMEEEVFNYLIQKKDKTKKEKNMLDIIGPVSEFEVYTSVKARSYYNAPHGGAIYLRKQNGSLTKPIRMMFCPKPNLNVQDRDGAPDVSSKGKKLWVTALRVAKHGKKLKDGYQIYTNDLREYKLKTGNSRDPRVPMDFTQGTGRIVHDKDEIEQIRKEPKQAAQAPRYERYESFPKETLEQGSHVHRKYYHGNLTRGDAEKMLIQNGSNGAWLLRDSYARANCLTISYLFEGRIHHKYVSAATHYDKSLGRKILVATLDQQTAFYDVDSLTQYYRLNKGDTMMCTLNEYIKKQSQRDNSPPRPSSDKPLPVPINLKKDGQNKDNGKSQKSLSNLITRSFQKSKQALKTKKSSVPNTLSLDAPTPSTSKSSPSSLKHEEIPLSPPASSATITDPSSSGVSSVAISSPGSQTIPDSPSSSSQEQPLVPISPNEPISSLSTSKTDPSSSSTTPQA